MKSATKQPLAVSWITNPSRQVYFVIISLGLILVYGASVYVYRPFDYIGWNSLRGGEIASLTEKGFREIGFQPGDLVLEIDNVPVDPWMQRPLYRPFLHPGDQVTYRVQRGENILTITSTMGSYLEGPDFLGWLVIGSLLSLSFWGTGTVLCLFSHPNEVRARLVGVSWLLAGIAVMMGGVATESQFWGYATLTKVSLSLLVFVNVAQHLYFPAPMFTPGQRGKLIGFVAAISLGLVALTVIDDGWIKPQMNLYSGLTHLVNIGFFLSIVLSIGLLVRNRFTAEDPDIRRQTGIVLFGTALGFAPFVILNLIPAFLFDSVETSPVYGVYPVLFLLLIPMSYAYVIYQRKLLKIDWVINRMVVQFVTVMLVLFLSIAILGSLAAVFGLSPELPVIGGLFASGFALTAATLEKRIRAAVDRIFYGTHYDHATITSSLSRNLVRTLDRQELTNLLTDDLPRQMGIRQCALLLADNGMLRLEIGSDGFSVNDNHAACARLLECGKPLRAVNLWDEIAETDQAEWLPVAWGEIFVPILYENRLRGILVAGERVTNDLYSEQDMQIFTTVAAQAALAIANIQLFETMRGLTRELVANDEELRRKVSLELHDSVLQNIFLIKENTTNPEMVGHLNDIIDALRRTIKMERTSMLEWGIAMALEDLIHDMRQVVGTGGARIYWQNEVDVTLRVPSELATNIYRILQEALNNAITHADADRIDVSFMREDNLLRLRIEDDGVGIPAEIPQAGQHYGLLGMRERALMSGASLEISSMPGAGTQITLGVTL